MPANEPLCPGGAPVSDPRLPDDDASWPERDLDRPDDATSRWPEPSGASDDDPYRYEPPPRWEPQAFEPPPADASAWHPPRFDDDDDDETGEYATEVAEPAEVEEPAFGQPASVEEGTRQEAEPAEYRPPEPDEPPYAEPFFQPISSEEPMPEVEPAAEPDAQPATEGSGEQDAEQGTGEWQQVAEGEQWGGEHAEPEGEAGSEPEAGSEGMAAPQEGDDAGREQEPQQAVEPEAEDEWAAAELEQAPESAGEPEPGPQVAEEPTEPREEVAQEDSFQEEEPRAEEPFEPEETPAIVAASSWMAEPASPPSPVLTPPATEAGEPVTAFGGVPEAWDPKLHGNRRRATTAEQAVPWLIGIILALAGMVIVLLALIFTSPNGLVAGGSATPTPSASAEASVGASPSGGIGGVVSDSAEPSATPPEPSPSASVAPPTYGALEMVYLGRPSGVAPIYLLRRDFSKKKQAEVMAQADQGIEKFAWAPDGTVGAAVISDRAVALRPGHNAKPLVDNVSALTFGWDASTLYAVRIARGGTQDRARVVGVNFTTAKTKLIATVSYKHPVTAPEAALREAQFIDDGGQVRLYAAADGRLVLWVLGAPNTYQIDPANGAVNKIPQGPDLWSPDGTKRIGLKESGSRTTIRLRDRDAGTIATTTVTGLVSHVRWAGTSNEIVFTLGVLSAGGGVRQDLYVWDLKDGGEPLPLTSTGAAFGAEWRGVMCNWLPAE
jgi:hypothetical protein